MVADRMRPSALPDDERAAVRALLPLPLVPARDRLGLRAQRADRGRSRRAAGGRRRSVVDTPSASGKGQKIARCPTLPDRGLEQLRRRRRRGPLHPRRHARRAGPAAARHPHLHRVEAALGACSIRACPRSRRTTTRRRSGARRAWSVAARCAPPDPAPSRGILRHDASCRSVGRRGHPDSIDRIPNSARTTAR